MGFNRVLHYRPGMLLVGDAGGLVNLFNGEASPTRWSRPPSPRGARSESLARRGAAAEKALESYPTALREALGGYYRIGNLFSRLIGNPTIMGLATRHGLPRRTLMEFLPSCWPTCTTRRTARRATA